MTGHDYADQLKKAQLLILCETTWNDTMNWLTSDPVDPDQRFVLKSTIYPKKKIEEQELFIMKEL